MSLLQSASANFKKIQDFTYQQIELFSSYVNQTVQQKP